MLRHKANFDILEGFLSELLSEQIKIKQILESESNKEYDNDKHNRVDILVENSNNELIIIEIQNSKEYDYLHRILFGTAKAISEHIKEGEPYSNIKKVISITIAYFDLGQGKDYVYHGTTNFKGIHQGDILMLADKQKELYGKENPYQIFPEYWLIKVSQFSGKVNDKLDEWIYFLKNGEVQEDFTAQGIVAAKDRLDQIKMSEAERREYQFYLKRLRDIASEQHTKMADAEDFEKLTQERIKVAEKLGEEVGKKIGEEIGKEIGVNIGKEIGRNEAQEQAVIGMSQNGIPVAIIAKSLSISEELVNEIIQRMNNQQNN